MTNLQKMFLDQADAINNVYLAASREGARNLAEQIRAILASEDSDATKMAFIVDKINNILEG